MAMNIVPVDKLHGSDVEQVFEDEKVVAEERNCDVVYADDSVLQLDIDSDEAYERYRIVRDRLYAEGLLNYRKTEEWRSRSGNRHVLIHLWDEVPVRQRILLQALLGSDLTRELLCLIRFNRGVEKPVRLFRPRP